MNSRTIIACIVSILFTSSTCESADVIYDTLNNSGGFAFVGFDQQLALSFRTTESGFNLESIALSLYRYNATTGTLTLGIYRANGSGNTPGDAEYPAISTIDVSSMPISPYEYSLTGLNYQLIPDSLYYLVMTGSGMNANAGWYQTSSSAGAGGSLGLSYISQSTGGAWLQINTYYLRGKIVAVPEPSTYASFGIASGLLAFLELLRRFRRSRIHAA